MFVEQINYPGMIYDEWLNILKWIWLNIDINLIYTYYKD